MPLQVVLVKGTPTAMADIDRKLGSLVIAGSGIASIRHITLETLSYIENAEKIYYLIPDAPTEAFIRDKSRGHCTDLSVYYDKKKHRYTTYVQISEVRCL